jgi:protein-S-isoprenylcysteine O-methyltransferase Ste14
MAARLPPDLQRRAPALRPQSHVRGSPVGGDGEAILFRSLLLAGYALLLWAAFHAFVVFVEEPSLRRRFGASCETYVHSFPRWRPRFPRG